MYKKLSIVFIFFILTTILILQPHPAFAAHIRFSWHWPTITPVVLLPKITLQPTSIPTLLPTVTPVTLAAIDPTLTANQAYIMYQINQYRTSLGLMPVQTSSQTCSFAAIRAKEISTNFSHAGFTARYENQTLPYESWEKVTENLAEAPAYQEVVGLWEHSPEHDANLRADTPYVCVAQYQDYFAYEGLKQ